MKQNRIFEKDWIKYKKCRNCEIVRELTEFYKKWLDSNWKHRYNPRCKYCSSMIERNKRKLDDGWRKSNQEAGRRYYHRHKERIKEEKRIKNKTPEEQRKQRLKRRQKYYKNRKTILANKRKRHAENKDT